jgi:hypothetical protein
MAWAEEAASPTLSRANVEILDGRTPKVCTRAFDDEIFRLD